MVTPIPTPFLTEVLALGCWMNLSRMAMLWLKSQLSEVVNRPIVRMSKVWANKWEFKPRSSGWVNRNGRMEMSA